MLKPFPLLAKGFFPCWCSQYQTFQQALFQGVMNANGVLRPKRRPQKKASFRRQPTLHSWQKLSPVLPQFPEGNERHFPHSFSPKRLQLEGQGSQVPPFSMWVVTSMPGFSDRLAKHPTRKRPIIHLYTYPSLNASFHPKNLTFPFRLLPQRKHADFLQSLPRKGGVRSGASKQTSHL